MIVEALLVLLTRCVIQEITDNNLDEKPEDTHRERNIQNHGAKLSGMTSFG